MIRLQFMQVKPALRRSCYRTFFQDDCVLRTDRRKALPLAAGQVSGVILLVVRLAEPKLEEMAVGQVALAVQERMVPFEMVELVVEG